MSFACLQALALDKVLLKNVGADRLAGTFFKRISRIIESGSAAGTTLNIVPSLNYMEVADNKMIFSVRFTVFV